MLRVPDQGHARSTAPGFVVRIVGTVIRTCRDFEEDIRIVFPRSLSEFTRFGIHAQVRTCAPEKKVCART